jgi:hypothetical protein
MKFIPCLLLFISIYCTINAQQTSDSGYIINHNRDTTRGFIKTSVDADLCESVSFRKNINNEWTRYGPSDLIGFCLYNETFRSIHFLNTTKGNTADTTFAKQLVSGEYNLFTYTNGSRRFFILQKDTTIYLLYDELFLNTGEIEQAANYQNYLYFISIPCDKLKNKSKQIGYDEKSISDFVQETNNCISGGSSVSYYKKQKMAITPIVFAGGLPMSGQQSQITANILLRFTIPRVDKQASLNIGLNYSSTTYMTADSKALNPYYQYYTRYQIMSIPVTVQYNLTQTRIQPYCYLGFSGTYNIEDNLATGFWVRPNDKEYGGTLVAGLGIEARIISGLFMRADWRYEAILEYPAIGLSYHF